MTSWMFLLIMYMTESESSLLEAGGSSRDFGFEDRTIKRIEDLCRIWNKMTKHWKILHRDASISKKIMISQITAFTGRISKTYILVSKHDRFYQISVSRFQILDFQFLSWTRLVHVRVSRMSAYLGSKIDSGLHPEIVLYKCGNLFAKYSYAKMGPPIFDESEADSLIVIISRYYSFDGQIKWGAREWPASFVNWRGSRFLGTLPVWKDKKVWN